MNASYHRSKELNTRLINPKKFGFYQSRKWKAIRYKTLTHYGAICQCCGARADDDVTIHVTHIKPRDERPDLQLEFDNLQVLCLDCSLGKSYCFDHTSWK